MKLTVLQENLNKGLGVAGRAVAARPQLPVLSHVLLSAEKGRLKISATNLETGINLWVGAKVETEGAVSVPAKIFAEFIASLPPEKVELTLEEGKLKVVSGRFEASFNGLDASEFPKISSVKGEPLLSLPGKELVQAVNQVAFAAASDEGRPVLTGVYFVAKDGELKLVATDGYRLSVKNLKTGLKEEGAEVLSKGLVIPARAFQEAARAASEDGEVKIYYLAEANQLIFAVGETEVISRLIEGQFPEFEKIIPTEAKIKAQVVAGSFSQAVRVAAIFARESANIIRFELKKEGIQMSSNTSQIGENTNLVEATVEGGEEKIAFNSRYLMDFLGAVGTERFGFEMTGPLNPGMFKPENDTSFLHIIMPVRVQD